MKKIFYILFVIAMMPVVSSCSDDEGNLEDLTKDEIIELFIKSQGIVVLKEYPEKHNFKPNEYYKTNLGLYFQVVDSGNGKSAIPFIDQINVRFDYYIDVNKYITGKRDTIIPSPYVLPMDFKYNSRNYGKNKDDLSCDGWNIPLDYIYEQAIVNLIIPPGLGTENDRSEGIIRFYKNLIYTKFW